MEVRYYVDPESGQPHIYDHGVIEAEVEQVLQWPLENRPGREGSRVVLGRTLGGRYLKVICVPDADGAGIFVVTAFALQGKALAALRRRMRRRGQR